MLWIARALADVPLVATVGGELLGEAQAGGASDAWLDADASVWATVRPMVLDMRRKTLDPARSGPVRALADDPAARRRAAEAATGARVAELRGCRIAPGTQVWPASSSVPPETRPWWPERARLLHTALVPLYCSSGMTNAALGLTETDGRGWRIASVLGSAEFDEWRALAVEVAADQVAERAEARGAAKAAAKPPILVQWSPPALAPIPPVPGDLDGDGYDEAFLRFQEIYWSATGSITRLDLGEDGHSWITGDQDGDGRAELLVTGGPRVEVWSAGDASRARTLEDVPAGVEDWSVGDVDGDGREDIIAVTASSALVWFATATRPGARLDFATSAPNVDFAGDMDGDGVGDLVFYDPAYDGDRGVMFFVHGMRAGQPLRSSTFVGEPGERAGDDGSFADIDGDGKVELLFQHWDGVRRRTTIEVVTSEGTTRASPIPEEFLGNSCDYGRTPRAGTRSTLAAWCATEVRVWSPEGGVRHLAIPPGTGGLRVLDTPIGPALAVITRTDVRWVSWDATSFDAATVVPRPADAAAWRVNALRPPADRPWLNPVVREKPTPAKRPAGAPRITEACIVNLAVGADGRVLDFTFPTCPDAVRADVSAALPSATWYPLENSRGPVFFRFRFLYR